MRMMFRKTRASFFRFTEITRAQQRATSAPLAGDPMQSTAARRLQRKRTKTVTAERNVAERMECGVMRNDTALAAA
jgi:hypothetical protein